jgi:hypothetical protein
MLLQRGPYQLPLWLNMNIMADQSLQIGNGLLQLRVWLCPEVSNVQFDSSGTKFKLD